MLVSRGVENDFGFIQRKRLFEFVSFANRSDNERIPRRVVSSGEFLIKEEHTVFVLIENDEVTAPEIESLTAEFRTDRPRAARYHYDLASHRSVDKFLTDFELVSAEKFLDLDVAERFYRGSDIIRVGDCGHYFNGEIERRKHVVDMAKLRFRYGRYRDDKRLYVIVFYDLFGVLHAAYDRDSVHELTLLFLVVVKYRDGVITLVRVIDTTVDYETSGVARADNYGAFAGRIRFVRREQFSAYVQKIMSDTPAEPHPARDYRAYDQIHYYYRDPDFYIDGELKNDFADEQNNERPEIRGDYFKKFDSSGVFPYRVVTVAHDEHYKQYGNRRDRYVRFDFEVSVRCGRRNTEKHYRSCDKVSRGGSRYIKQHHQ